MTISLHWLKRHFETELSVYALCELLTDLGLEVEGQSTYQSLKGGLEGVFIGEVLTREQHPNADRLSVTTVRIAADAEPLHIVCGAPNVAAGQKVVVATVGCTLYPLGGEPLTLKKGKIRGEVSEGMICAEDELGLGSSHEGILVLPADTPVGLPAAKYFGVENDTIIEIGLTPNRADAMSHRGVAQDLAAACEARGLAGRLLPLDLSGFAAPNEAKLPVKIEVLNPEACPRYAGICLEGIQVGPSPDWLQHRLRAIGLEPINNVVDITNFVQHDLGQPLHAFDYDAIKGQGIRVGCLPEGTKFKTLDGVERELRAQDLLICDAQDQPMCLAGVFGGLDSGVKASTTRIFLESACFAPTSIRRTSLAHQLRTDAAGRFEKGTDPEGVIPALKLAVLLLQEHCGAKLASPLYDHYPQTIAPAQPMLRRSRIASLLGVTMSEEELQAILKALNFSILSDDGQTLQLQIPGNKPDVRREADVLEELLRIYGYNRVPELQTLQSVLSFQDKPNRHAWRNHLAERLSAQGFLEIQTVSLSRSAYYQNADFWDFPAEELVPVNNTSNQELDLLRPSLLPGGLEVIRHNINRQQPNLRLYEFGKTYRRKAEGEYQEEDYLGLWLSGQALTAQWLQTQAQPMSFYHLKAYVEGVFQTIGLDIKSLQTNITENQGPWAYSLQWHRGKQVFARLGLVKGLMLREMSIKQPVFYAELPLASFWPHLRKAGVKYQSLPKYPAVERDLALLVDKDFAFERLAQVLRKQGKTLLQNIELFDVYSNAEQLGPDKKSYAVRLTFQDPQKTLGEADIDRLMQNIIAACEKDLGAKLRS